MTSFYSDPAVRRRLAEFLGGESPEHATAVFITRSDGYRYDPAALRRPAELDFYLERETDIARSLADTESLLMHLDIEYVNFDSPAEAYLDSPRVFDLQEPVVRAVETLLLRWGIRPLHLVTGQGHHFIWRIAWNSETALLLRGLNPCPELTERHHERTPEALREKVGAGARAAFAAQALVMEYVAHRVKTEAAPLCAVPVEITAVHVGHGALGKREMISLDISEYGDPLHTRVIRMPFTDYVKPWVTGLANSLGAGNRIPSFRAIPLHEIDIRQALMARQVEASVLDLARRASVRIPEESMGSAALLAEYLTSPLRRFHEWYYSERHDPPESWPHTYDRLSPDSLPPCVRHILTWPNDLLLKPAGMQLVTRCLLAADWHPRHIAGLIRSKFENPLFNWNTEWSLYDAATRADFYTRLFAGLHATGLDRLVDFNCRSNGEKGFCFPHDGENCTLEPARQTLLNRPVFT